MKNQVTQINVPWSFLTVPDGQKPSVQIVNSEVKMNAAAVASIQVAPPVINTNNGLRSILQERSNKSVIDRGLHENSKLIKFL